MVNALLRPLLTAWMLACTSSLITQDRLTARLVIPTAVYWSLVPLFGIAGLAAVYRRRPGMPAFGEAIDRYFASQRAWLLWLTLFTAIWAVLPPREAFVWLGYRKLWLVSLAAVILWTCRADYLFFVRVAKRSTGGALRDLAIERLITWGCTLAWFAGGSIRVMLLAHRVV